MVLGTFGKQYYSVFKDPCSLYKYSYHYCSLILQSQILISIHQKQCLCRPISQPRFPCLSYLLGAYSSRFLRLETSRVLCSLLALLPLPVSHGHRPQRKGQTQQSNTHRHHQQSGLQYVKAYKMFLGYICTFIMEEYKI